MMSLNRDTFLQHGVYISEAFARYPGGTNSWHLVYALQASGERLATYHNSIRCGYSSERCESLRDECRSALIQDLKKAQDLEKKFGKKLIYLISTEEIAFFSRAESNQMYSLFLDYSESVEVLYYYRSPLCRLRSDIQQASKGGVVHLVSHLPKIVPQDKPRVERLSPLPDSAECVSLTVRPYLKDLDAYKTWDVRKDFLDYL